MEEVKEVKRRGRPPKVKAQEAQTEEQPIPESNGERKKIWVRAVNRIGYYGDVRRYPVGHGHPRSGLPFQIWEDEFSDSSKKTGLGIFGWMEKVDKNTKPIVRDDSKLSDLPRRVKSVKEVQTVI